MPSLIRKLGPEVLRFVDSVRRYNANPLSSAQRYWTLYRHRRFSPDEIHFQRLLSPEVDLRRAVSKEELLAVQAQLNPRAFHARTEDKICFHRFCLEAGLPVPEIFGLLDFEADPGYDDIRLLGDEESLLRFLRDPPSDSMILKPVAGVNGEGVMRLDRVGMQWRDTHGTILDVDNLMARMREAAYGRWIFQEVIQGHDELRNLSNTTGLQTVRVVTVLDESDSVRILAARLRLICGDVAHDNFEFGKTGNVIAILDPETGVIESAVGGAKERYEMQAVTHHPSTGRELIGFPVPNWAAVRQLSIDAAERFRPLRTIGWDVAITSEAPCLIEGNVTWATLSGESRMGEIYRYLKGIAAANGG
jgi:hypothetical protein